MENKKTGVWGALIIGICVLLSCIALAFGLSHFRSESSHTISATGSASVDFDADIIIWRGSFSAVDYSSQAAYAKIKSDADEVKKYLTNNSIAEDEIVFSAVDIRRTYRDVYDANGNLLAAESIGGRVLGAAVSDRENHGSYIQHFDINDQVYTKSQE